MSTDMSTVAAFHRQALAPAQSSPQPHMHVRTGKHLGGRTRETVGDILVLPRH